MHVKKSSNMKITEIGGNPETLVDPMIKADQTNFKWQFFGCHI